MQIDLSPLQLAAEIKRIFTAHPGDGERRIPAFLEERLGALPLKDRIGLVQRVLDHLDEEDHAPGRETEVAQDVRAKLFQLVMGRKASEVDLQSQEQMAALSRTLNTIFDTLNRLVNVINTTLRGNASQQETIRGLIGESLADPKATVSLVEYLGQIERAFLLSQKAFKEAARALVEEILVELDPDRIEGRGAGYRFGPFHKAEKFELFREKHRRCRRWLASERFEERLLRKFEEHCSRLFDV